MTTVDRAVVLRRVNAILSGEACDVTATLKLVQEALAEPSEQLTSRENNRMVSDLVKWLRADAEFTNDIGLCADVADRIEELKAALKVALDTLRTNNQDVHLNVFVFGNAVLGKGE